MFFLKSTRIAYYTINTGKGLDGNLEIGERIKQYREYLGLNQEEFGIPVGVKKAHISDIERGERKPSLELLSRIIDSFSIDARYFYNQIDEPASADLSKREDPKMSEVERLTSVVEGLRRYVTPATDIDPLAARVSIDSELRDICELIAYKDGSLKQGCDEISRSLYYEYHVRERVRVLSVSSR